MSSIEIDRDDFLNLLGVDYENAGKLVKIICPFHDDNSPSLAIYPDMDEACHCFACGETCSWPYLLAKIKGVSFPEACRMMELPDGNYGDGTTKGQIKIDIGFCDEPKFAGVFDERHNQCSKVWPLSGDKWLEKKGLCRVAQDLDWRWHDGTVYKHWGKGFVIPYKVDGKVVWERFRGEAIEGNFEKPIGPAQVGIQPYFDTFRKNDTVYLVEGESDAASIYDHGGSAIGIPGAKAKKAINTVACFINDQPYINRIVLCGDRDVAGQDMNRLYREAIARFVERNVEVIEYEHKTEDKKADVNDDHARHLLKIPIKWTSFYDKNHERNYGLFGSQTASKAIERQKTIMCKERVVTWLKNKNTH